MVVAGPCRCRLQVVRELVAHEAVGGLEAAVEVEGGDHAPRRRPPRARPSSGRPSSPRPGRARRGRAAPARAARRARLGAATSWRARLALAPLRPLGIAAVQQVGHHEAEHRVPQELQGLVVAASSGLEILVGVAGVGERAVEQREVREAMAQPALERAQLVLAVLRHRSRSPIGQATFSTTSVMSSCWAASPTKARISARIALLQLLAAGDARSARAGRAGAARRTAPLARSWPRRARP